ARSRPHKDDERDASLPFSVWDKRYRQLTKRLPFMGDTAGPKPVVLRGDARHLGYASNTVDAVLTSPPYLNAIDYLRGHKFSLVWMGLSISDLRSKRSNNVGSEKRSDRSSEDKFLREFCLAVPFIEKLTPREQRIFHRYILDLTAVLTEMHRVLKPGGKAVLVVGNST